MKKILLTILFFVLFQPACLAEKLPYIYTDYLEHGDESLYPITTKYMQDYAQQLYKEFNPNQFLARNWLFVLQIQINRDGSISDIKCNRIDTQFKIYIFQLLKDNPPKPIPKEIENEFITTDIAFASTDKHHVWYLQCEYFIPEERYSSVIRKCQNRFTFKNKEHKYAEKIEKRHVQYIF